MTPLPRWTVSFADLSLLLLASFILLTLGEARSVSAPFEAASASHPVTGPLLHQSAGNLFEPGEARLRQAVRPTLLAIGRRAASDGSPVTIESRGQDQSASRFDAWELAAARTAAIARILNQAGVAEKRIVIVMPTGGQGSESQWLTIRHHR